jgi:protein ImuB
MRTLVLWCPDWSVTALGYQPNVPVAVMVANRIVACSLAARQAGVLTGMRQREAESMAPGLVVAARDIEREARLFEPVVAAVSTISPLVEVPVLVSWRWLPVVLLGTLVAKRHCVL